MWEAWVATADHGSQKFNCLEKKQHLETFSLHRKQVWFQFSHHKLCRSWTLQKQFQASRPSFFSIYRTVIPFSKCCISHVLLPRITTVSFQHNMVLSCLLWLMSDDHITRGRHLKVWLNIVTKCYSLNMINQDNIGLGFAITKYPIAKHFLTFERNLVEPASFTVYLLTLQCSISMEICCHGTQCFNIPYLVINAISIHGRSGKFIAYFPLQSS